MAKVATGDVTVAAIDEMDPIHGGVARRARAELGVSSWGMQVLTLPPHWEDYPNHNHDAAAFDPEQEEVYIPISGSATLFAGDEQFERAEKAVMRRFVEAWEAVDIERLTGLLADDALLTMPPEPTRANGQPALAAFVQERPGEPFRAYGIMVFALDGDRIAGITGFAGYPQLFPLFELPSALS